ncbi:MAG: 30S ribosomal protein S8 [Nitrososphaerales archaeon]
MPAKNILANMFSTIQNNEIRRKKECLVIPASNLAREVLRTIQRYKYIGEFEYIDDGLLGKFRIQLLGRVNKCGVVSPRFAVKKDKYIDWERRFLPAIGRGILIVSTPKGIMSHSEAMNLGLGGRLVGYIY